ncbi:MAG: nucleoside diphosphate kinase regulator [Casimicrobiaceae bacterium]
MPSDDLFLTDDDYARVVALEPDPQLRKELDRAVVVPPSSISSGIVTLYSRIRYLDEQTGAHAEVQLVHPGDANTELGKVSVLAPIGAALLGLALGQAIDWEFPDGQTRRLRVEEILYQPETWPREAADGMPESF